MTSYDRGDKPKDYTPFQGFDHLEFYVGNAYQAATYYCARFGFTPVAHRGLTTGSRDLASHVVRQNKIVFVFTSYLNPDADHPVSKHQALHGDGVKDVAFACDDARAVHAKAVSRGAKSIQEPQELEDEHGKVVIAKLQTYGDTIHTLITRVDYTGPFMPGYKAYDSEDPLLKGLPTPELGFIDHVVGNQPDGKMIEVANWYEKYLDFHRFWSVDDKQVHTKYSALRSVVMTDWDRVIKMPINEPAEGLKKSQIQEYVEYYGGAGVQHIALNTPNILNAVKSLRERGVQFLTIPKSYYKLLRERLSHSPVNVKEDLDTIESLDILVDFDDQGYLLQIFTKPQEDRPTLFIEIIQRNNHEGFGAGNFKSLFESLELDQAARGNL